MVTPLQPFTYSINEHGVTIEHGIFAPTSLNDGRCCGRKPLVYKTGGLRFFCHKCDREYAPDGKQRQNRAYKLLSNGDFIRDRPLPWDEAQTIEAAGVPVVGVERI